MTWGNSFLLHLMPTSPHLAKYLGLKKWGWYMGDFSEMKRELFSDQPRRALEIGAFDGVSANMMLDELFPHPDSMVHAIDPYLPDPTTPQVSGATRAQFMENASRGGHEDQIVLHHGCSIEVLAGMLLKQPYRHSFDFIYIDGSHFARHVLIDAVMSWNLLKVGGVIGFDDYKWTFGPDKWHRPRLAIDAFATVFVDRTRVCFQNTQKFLRKLQE